MFFCKKFRGLPLFEKESAVEQLGACRECLACHKVGKSSASNQLGLLEENGISEPPVIIMLMVVTWIENPNSLGCISNSVWLEDRKGHLHRFLWTDLRQNSMQSLGGGLLCGRHTHVPKQQRQYNLTEQVEKIAKAGEFSLKLWVRSEQSGRKAFQEGVKGALPQDIWDKPLSEDLREQALKLKNMLSQSWRVPKGWTS
ncbi:hypothetical protein Q8A73_009165 [Channa argus]|nr:hypothetical protein Q8A73_009165 [Channa argus]